MKEAEKIIRERLFSMGEEVYRDFQSALMPTVDKSRVLGVRTPALRKYAAEIAKTPLAAEFMSVLPHEYYEGNNLHAFILEKIKDYDAVVRALDAFLPYVDNWATCDCMAPRVLAKHPQELCTKIDEWLLSGKTYTVRYGIGALMRYYLDENFREEYLAKVAGIVSEEYYVNMMIAWYFATALAKQYDATLPYLEKYVLSPWVHNKTIQKACESNRVCAEHKTYLRTLKVK